MRNVSDKNCRESQNTHFMFNNFFLKIVPLWDNMGKYSRAGQARDDKIILCKRYTCRITRLRIKTQFWLMTTLMHFFSMCLFHACTCGAGPLDIHPPECVIPDEVLIKFGPPDDEHLLLETCRGPPDRPTRHPPTRVCYTRWSINKTWSSWWLALVARNV